jgi:hypothetical protein
VLSWAILSRYRHSLLYSTLHWNNKHDKGRRHMMCYQTILRRDGENYLPERLRRLRYRRQPHRRASLPCWVSTYLDMPTVWCVHSLSRLHVRLLLTNSHCRHLKIPGNTAPRYLISSVHSQVLPSELIQQDEHPPIISCRYGREVVRQG